MWGPVTCVVELRRHLHQARDEDGVGGGALRLAEGVEDHLAVLRLRLGVEEPVEGCEVWGVRCGVWGVTQSSLGVEEREQLHERLHREHRPKVGHRRALLEHVGHHPLQLRLQLQVRLLRRDALHDVAQQLAHLYMGIWGVRSGVT